MYFNLNMIQKYRVGHSGCIPAYHRFLINYRFGYTVDKDSVSGIRYTLSNIPQGIPEK